MPLEIEPTFAYVIYRKCDREIWDLAHDLHATRVLL